MDIFSFLSTWYRLVKERLVPRKGICNICRHYVRYIPFKKGDTLNGSQIPMIDKGIHWICPICQVGK